MSNRNLRSFLLLFLCALLVFLGLVSPVRGTEKRKDVAPSVKSELTQEQRQKNIESFDMVWETIRDTHYDPKLGGVNWEAVREELRPQLDKASSMEQVREVMFKMIERLNHSHVTIIPGWVYEDTQNDKGGGNAGPGFDVRMADGDAVVVRVVEDLPAAKAGVRQGWRIS